MLTGIPPFQSNTQEEIYRKVKNIDYVWPEDTSCSNFIPKEAKGLVSMMLRVDAAERPDPDLIVTHRFFSMRDRNPVQNSLIPKRLSTESRQQKPAWLMPCIPNGDVMDPDSDRISLEELCRECGVGQFKDAAGNELGVLDVVGKDVEKSLYKEFVEEQKRGLTPVVPLPTETVYISHPILDSWPSAHTPRVEPASGTRTDVVGSQIPVLEPLQNGVPTLPKQAGRPSQCAPPSHAAQLRTQASRQPSQTVGRASSRVVSVNNDTLRRARNGVSSTSSVNSGTGLLNNIPLHSTQQPSVGTDRQSQTLPRRFGRVTRSATSGSNRDGGASVSATAATTRVSRSASARALQYDLKTINGLGNDEKERERAAFNTKARIAATVREEMLEVAKTRRDPLPVYPRSESGSSKTNGVLIGRDEVAEYLPSTMPETIQSALKLFHNNLDATLKNPHTSSARITREGQLRTEYDSASNRDESDMPDSLKGRPVVIKWVDYTNKFGIGYILANGSVGCVFKGEDGKPPTCIIVHGGEDHLRKRKVTAYTERHQIVPTGGVPIEFFENCGEEGMKRVFVHPKTYKINISADGIAEKLGPGTNIHDYEKRKKLILWDKFAKYMTQTLGKSDEEEDPPKSISANSEIHPSDPHKLQRSPPRPFIKFYQRLGNVGIWGFGNNSFQFNFPDHTKLVLSPTASHLDFYHLPLAAASLLQAGQPLPADALDARSVLSCSVAAMLAGFDAHGGNVSELVAANELRAKLEFVRDVVGVWVKSGGLGCMGPGERRRMKWEGVREGGGRQKLVWVTVGANGGDGAYEQVVVEGVCGQGR